MLGLFVDPLTADNKYSVLNRGNFLQLSQKQETFSYYFFFFHILKFNSILNIFKKKMTLTADVFLN